MGFLDSLFGKSRCPRCGSKGARKSGNQTRCPNPSCQFFDATLRAAHGGFRVRESAPPSRSDYSPESPVEIHYRNFRGEEKSFIAEKQTLRRKRNHIVAQVAPTGENISLSRDRIQNLADVEDALSVPAESEDTSPTARERQVLSYHKKHKSTSPLYEEIRSKYPDW